LVFEVTIAVSEKNRMEMSAARDFPNPGAVRRRYCILSSPRSGSTLLARMLYATGLAGDPQEYFNPPLLQYERDRLADQSLSYSAFLRGMERRRTSPNGVFGLKTHFHQLLSAFGATGPNQEIIDFLKRHDALIWIRRRHRVRQAISQALAQRTLVWSSEDPRFGDQGETRLHPYECALALQFVCNEDFAWEQLIGTAGLTVHELWYEDLIADYPNQCRAVLRHLGLDGAVAEIPPPQLRRQSSPLNASLQAELVRYLGLHDDVLTN
jgi:trehalose 2-sulfotransferase